MYCIQSRIKTDSHFYYSWYCHYFVSFHSILFSFVARIYSFVSLHHLFSIHTTMRYVFVLTIWPNRLADIRCFGRSIPERRNLAIVVSSLRADPRKMVQCHASADKHQIPFSRRSTNVWVYKEGEEKEKKQ